MGTITIGAIDIASVLVGGLIAKYISVKTDTNTTSATADVAALDAKISALTALKNGMEAVVQAFKAKS